LSEKRLNFFKKEKILNPQPNCAGASGEKFSAGRYLDGLSYVRAKKTVFEEEFRSRSKPKGLALLTYPAQPAVK